MNDLEKSILNTLAFFDVFKYPLTATEIWKWLWKPERKYSLSEVREVLADSELLKSKLSSAEGFYALKGSEYFYLLRKQNNNLAERKFRRVCRLAKVYKFIPFVRMIAVCNTLAYSNARESSDIDLFIITKRGKIWLARFFTVVFVKFLGLQTSPEEHQDTFCLSFFIDESNLNIQSVTLKDKDVYFPFWVEQLMPIYNPDALYEKFLRANDWYLKYLPNGYRNQFSKEVYETKFSRFMNRIFYFIFSPPILSNVLDRAYRRLQLRIIDKNLKEMVNIDSRVIVNEAMLKFHDNDRREEFYKKWRETTNILFNKNEGQII